MCLLLLPRQPGIGGLALFLRIPDASRIAYESFIGAQLGLPFPSTIKSAPFVPSQTASMYMAAPYNFPIVPAEFPILANLDYLPAMSVMIFCLLLLLFKSW